MTPSIYQPLRPFIIGQHFGDSQACVKDFGLSSQKISGSFPDGTCPVGYEKLYPKFGMKGHNGVDLFAGEQPVYAAMDGVIVEQQSVPARGLGLGILSHEQYDFPEGKHYLKLRYWHLKSFTRNVGDTVRVGDILGITDNTGYSSGNHLHFEGQLMDKDKGGHPFVINKDNGYSGGVNIEPYFNGVFAGFTFTKNLWYGQENKDVLELQKRLGVDYSTGPGYFGYRTLRAVLKYQKAQGITQTGFVGPLTRAALNL